MISVQVCAPPLWRKVVVRFLVTNRMSSLFRMVLQVLSLNSSGGNSRLRKGYVISFSTDSPFLTIIHLGPPYSTQWYTSPPSHLHSQLIAAYKPTMHLSDMGNLSPGASHMLCPSGLCPGQSPFAPSSKNICTVSSYQSRAVKVMQNGSGSV